MLASYTILQGHDLDNIYYNFIGKDDIKLYIYYDIPQLGICLLPSKVEELQINRRHWTNVVDQNFFQNTLVPELHTHLKNKVVT